MESIENHCRTPTGNLSLSLVTHHSTEVVRPCTRDYGHWMKQLTSPEFVLARKLVRRRAGNGAGQKGRGKRTSRPGSLRLPYQRRHMGKSAGASTRGAPQQRRGAGRPTEYAAVQSKEPVLNAMAGELAYLIAPLGLDLRAAHSWSKKNEVCNHLSRLSPGERPNKTELVGAV